MDPVAIGKMMMQGYVSNVRTLPEEKQTELASERAISKLDQNPVTDDIAIAVYMMCTHAADGITGECLIADSGMSHNIVSRQPAIEEYPKQL